MELKLEQSQRTVLTQTLRQSLEILKMSAAELDAYLAAQALENPFIHYERNPAIDRRPIPAGGEDADAYQNMLAERHRGKSLSEHLTEQLMGLHLSSQQTAHVRYLIENLDARGYLNLSSAQIGQALRIPQDAARRALNTLMSLEPAGVGARTLRECLYLQLKRMKPRRSLCETLVKDHLKDLAQQRYGMLSERYGVDRDAVLDAVRVIRSLNPKPGNGFAEAADIPYAPPDLIVSENADGTRAVALNPALQFRYSVDTAYCSQMRRAASSGKERAYLTRQLNSAVGIGRGIERRGQTLLRCGQAILTRQAAFFDDRAAALSPLTMRELADALSLNPSTITRAVRDKTLLCRWGAYPLETFFVRSVTANADAPLSPAALKARIAALIKQEDADSPLSDRAIAEQLSAGGMAVSRRVVTKYREELFLPSSFQRGRERARGE